MKKILFLTFLLPSLSFAGEFRFEAALADFARNEIAIPGDNGDLFDTAEKGWSQASGKSFRIYFAQKLDKKSSLRLLYAPLATTFNGSFGETTNFNGENFLPGKAKVNYRFNSYRLGYHRQLGEASEALTMNWGVVLKVRDAEIEVVQGSNSSSRKDLGLVPLLHFDLRYNFYKDLSLYFDMDGMAAPQGRAFDGGLFLQRSFAEKYEVFAGYRFLEGGADNDKVKTFSYVHYYTMGLSFRL